jgi:acetolactate synthase-1/2/3 large subunit
VYTATAEALREAGQEATVATFDVGIHQMKGAQWFPVSNPRSWITSGGMGSMGCALPMAVGAHFARPQATVLAFCGDGGFVMSSHELDTIGAYGLPIKLIVFDDSALGMVQNWHGLYFAGRALTSDRRRGRTARAVDVAALKQRLREGLQEVADADGLAALLGEATAATAQAEWPLFAGAAAAYGIPAERVHTRAQLAPALRRALTTPGPYLLQIRLPATHGVYPLMEPGTTPQEIIWRETLPGSGVRVPAGERFDYAARHLRAEAGSSSAAVG